ncbi:hypothetical protein PIB30_039181 [Stylosanthes scabra]|uniref:Uncharacterized protein n=1 Tax=Stylosanthes scabra TaxID=79078 RepID=A0ABU6XCA4_9FABA|nr:hypothetical protein [Stylosanthes scabra]
MALYAQRTVMKPYPIKRASDNVGLRMGTGIIFYEALTEDAYQTLDFKMFDPDLPYNHPLSTLCPGDGIRHPSPPPEPYPMPPFGPSTSQQGFDLDQFGVPMILPLSYYPSVYDPSVDLIPVKIEPRSPPPGDVAAPVDEDPAEDPMDEDEADVEMADTDTGEEDVSDGDEPSVSSGAAGSDERSEISTDTCESRA